MTFPFKLFMVIKENPPLMPFFLTAQKRLGFFRAIFQGLSWVEVGDQCTAVWPIATYYT